MEAVVDVQRWLPVLMTQKTSGIGIDDMSLPSNETTDFYSLVITYTKEGSNSHEVIALDETQWKASPGGAYQMLLPTGAFDTVGELLYLVTHPECYDYHGAIDVVVAPPTLAYQADISGRLPAALVDGKMDAVCTLSAETIADIAAQVATAVDILTDAQVEEIAVAVVAALLEASVPVHLTLTNPDARSRIEMLTQWDMEPTLTSAEIDMLLADSAVIDADGRYINDDDWVPTFQIGRAVSRGWMLKASKIVGNYQFSDSGQTFSRQQIHEHCMAMVKEYQRLSSQSVSMGSDMAKSLELIPPPQTWVNWNTERQEYK